MGWMEQAEEARLAGELRKMGTRRVWPGLNVTGLGVTRVVGTGLVRGWRAVRERLRGWAWARPAGKRLRLRESLSLGEKRMVAVIEFDRRELLLGVTASAVSLLAESAARELREGGDAAAADGGRG